MTAANPLLQSYAPAPLAFERGQGAYLYTADGQRYLDFAGGVAVTLLGHAHPHLVQALKEQAEKVWHVGAIFTIPGMQNLAQRLVDATFADRIFFTNSGAEAIECGIKLVRRFMDRAGKPDRYRLTTFAGAFHGRTLATIAAGGNPKYLDGFGPAVDGFDQVPFGNLDAVKAAIGPQTAGILVEPVQGEGGVMAAPTEFLRALRRICDEQGLLLFLDEVQCGMGRTGKLFAHEWAQITPDVMAVAKGIGGGFPLGACLCTEAVGAAMTPGAHGSTYGGNPLAMAVGNAVMDIVLAPGFLDHVQQISNDLRQQLAGLAERHPDVIETVRGAGLLLGLKARLPNTDLQKAAQQEGLLTVTAGDNVLRLLPPLVITRAEVQEAIEALDAACLKLSNRAH